MVNIQSIAGMATAYMVKATAYMVKNVIVLYRIHETIFILTSLKCYFSYPKNQYLSCNFGPRPICIHVCNYIDLTIKNESFHKSLVFLIANWTPQQKIRRAYVCAETHKSLRYSHTKERT